LLSRSRERESLSSAAAFWRGAARRGEPRGVNLVKAVIKLISYLEDARMYRADRESGPAASRSFSL